MTIVTLLFVYYATIQKRVRIRRTLGGGGGAGPELHDLHVVVHGRGSCGAKGPTVTHWGSNIYAMYRFIYLSTIYLIYLFVYFWIFKFVCSLSSFIYLLDCFSYFTIFYSFIFCSFIHWCINCSVIHLQMRVALSGVAAVATRKIQYESSN